MPEKKIIKRSGKAKKPVFIGVAWPYVNGDLHIGHLAGYLLPADVFSRFCRLTGRKTLMVSGADCYGTPIIIEADKENKTPKEIVEKYYGRTKKLLKAAEIDFDLFTKTTAPNHNKIVQDFFLRLLENGYISKKTTKQFYSETDKKFLPDRYVEGECPFCRTKDTRSDQCDNCGRVLNPEELINPKSKITKGELILKDTEHYFLEWPKLEKFLNAYYKKTHKNWRPWIQKETENWLKGGLKPRAITRDLDWGVKIPIARISKEMQLDGAENKRIYVWFDAVIGYLSASIEWAFRCDSRQVFRQSSRQAFRCDSKYAVAEKIWKEFWYKDSDHYYFLGKDNLVFHTIFWPGQLYAYDKKINLPDYPIINQFLTLQGHKFSKSRGITVSSEEIVKNYGADAVRFYFTSIMPENNDTDFSWDDFKNRINGSLIGNYGNFVNRVLNLSKGLDLKSKFSVSPVITKRSEKAFRDAYKSLSANRYKDYVEAFLGLADFGNKYLTEKKPWEAKKSDFTNYRQTMIDSLYLLLALNLIMKPMMPGASKNLEKQSELKTEKWPELEKLDFELTRQMKTMKLPKNIKPLFRKIEESEIEAEKTKLPEITKTKV